MKSKGKKRQRKHNSKKNKARPTHTNYYAQTLYFHPIAKCSQPISSARGKMMFRTAPNPSYIGLAFNFGREGWKAGYETHAFGTMEGGGWGLPEWEGPDYSKHKETFFSNFDGNKKFFQEVGRRVNAAKNATNSGNDRKRSGEGNELSKNRRPAKRERKR